MATTKSFITTICGINKVLKRCTIKIFGGFKAQNIAAAIESVSKLLAEKYDHYRHVLLVLVSPINSRTNSNVCHIVLHGLVVS